MKTTYLAAALAATLALAAPVQAQVSAQELWQNAQTVISGEGARLSAQESRDGDALVLAQPLITFPKGETLRLPDITLRDLSGGAVEVVLPPKFPLTLEMPPKPGAPSRLTFSVSAPGFALVLRNLDAMGADFDLAAPSLTATLDPVVQSPGDSTSGPTDLSLTLAVADLSLKHRHSADPAQMQIDSTLALGTIHAELRADIPSEKTNGTMSLDLSALAAHLKGNVPPDAKHSLTPPEPGQSPDFAAFTDLLDKGMMLDAGLSHGPIAISVDAPMESAGPNALSVSVANGSATLTVDRTGVLYDATSGASRFYYRGNAPDIPLPELEFSLNDARAMFRLGLPDDGKYAAIYRIGGLAASQGLWDLADPGRVIPRDPLTFSLDVSGNYALDPAVLQSGWKATPDSPPPLDTLTVKLGELLLSGAGASITGSGDVALDFTAMQTAKDVPGATGNLTFVTLGANALLDRLVKLGIVTPDNLTAARMGLMFIGKIEGGADRLVTRLEFNDKSFSLNGQKLR